MDHVTRVRAWLKEQSYDGVILSRRDNFTWISGGAKNAVCTNAEAGIGYYVISAGEVKLLADSSDAPRMGAEQNPLGGEVVRRQEELCRLPHRGPQDQRVHQEEVL